MTDELKKTMNDIRCKKCGALLLKGEIVKVEIKCRKCHYINKLDNDIKNVVSIK